MTSHTSPGAVVIELRDVKKHFTAPMSRFGRRGVIKAADGVSLLVHQGETYALIGESGSGKSTIANIILGLLKPTSGAIYIEGDVVSGRKRRGLKDFRRWTQAVFQDPVGSLDPRMRIGSIIAEPLILNRPDLARADVDERVGHLLSEVSLPPGDARRYPHQFSGGQRQRIAIARALSIEPRLVLLDEPVSALDVSTSAQILNLLRDLQARRGMSYFLIAHNLATVSHMADRIGVIYCGRIVETGPGGKVFSQPLHPYTKLLMRAAMPKRLDTEDASLALKGEPPSPLNPPRGCHFHPRCPFAMPICSEEEPVLKQVDGSHEVACHLY